ncbi:MAG: hypothetical protein ACXAC7_18225 [Candidatus Hodarchaeales archaeon]|jgi:hypothetical protein
MPIKYIIELTKSELLKFIDNIELILEIQSNHKSSIKIEFTKEEKLIFHEILNNNKDFESIIFELPGAININDVITNDIIADRPPKLKITVREQYKQKGTYLEYQ